MYYSDQSSIYLPVEALSDHHKFLETAQTSSQNTSSSVFLHLNTMPVALILIRVALDIKLASKNVCSSHEITLYCV